MKRLKIELSVNEINQILEALGNMPYIKVHDLITSIQHQANEQLVEQKATANTQEDSGE